MIVFSKSSFRRRGDELTEVQTLFAVNASEASTPHKGSLRIGGVAWKINSEVVLLLGWGRAMLLQLAHPLVASGVAEHSSFNASPGARLQRLRQTIEAMLALTFGTPEEVTRATDAINAMHDRVHGKLSGTAGNIPAGTRYSAHDPKLLTWVHATLLDSFLSTYELYVGPLTLEEKNRYCAQARSIEPLLGIPSGSLPSNLAELRSYMDEMFASGEIAVTETARHIAPEVVSPPTLWVMRPLLWFFSLPTIGLLPTAIREAYGYRWVWWHEASLRLSAGIVRALLPFVSSTFRHWPKASRFWFAILERTERLVS
ncbi:DUF2236 domain-containing protein [Acidobacteria bacterium AH-259-G07]|nr:DUF2236 domain-containing protein [Acidobacteria bacterium AH-259-G07]